MKIPPLLREILTPWESVRRIKRIENQVACLATEIHEARMANLFLTGQVAAHALRKDLKSIQEAEFQVFSQFGEDGIIQFLVRALDGRIDKSFVEFGVQNYMESNTLFLLMNNGWRGLIIDGEQRYIDGIRKRGFDWKYGLRARCEFVSRDNINQIFAEEGFGDTLGLLSIDVDGIDWHLWDALKIVGPGIVIVEYNRSFPMDRPITVPYEPLFDRSEKHYTGWYFGSSLGALIALADEKGYSFAGVDSHNGNAFFVRNDLAGLVPNDVMRKEQFGTDPEKVTEVLRGMPVYNAVTKAIESF